MFMKAKKITQIKKIIKNFCCKVKNKKLMQAIEEKKILILKTENTLKA